jgi:hypothetical protein
MSINTNEDHTLLPKCFLFSPLSMFPVVRINDALRCLLLGSERRSRTPRLYLRNPVFVFVCLFCVFFAFFVCIFVIFFAFLCV